MADEYFLVDVPAHARFRPLFPEILPDLLKSVPETDIGIIADLVVSYYRNLYEYLAQDESCWVPELILDLAQALMKLPDLSYAKGQIIFSVRQWLKLHHLPQSEDLGELLTAMESALTTADVEYVEKLNRCLADAGENRFLDVADACFKRAINRCRREDYEAAISDFDQAIQLKPGQAEVFYNRGLVYACLEQYEKAAEDYTESLRLSPENANAYNNRANAYYKLGEHQKAIDDYDEALKIRPDLPEAEKNRAIAKGVLDEICRKKAEEEEQRRKAEEERLRREKEEEERKGREFEFEIVFVDAKGNITRRENKKARQQVEDLGNGVALEMVYVPGGTFTMDSRQVTVSPFFMGKYQLTQAQWEAIMGNNPSDFKGENRPVEQVSWEDAVEFCKKLSQKTGKTYRLPTEAEWEYACRAGTTTPFYFGETITPDLVNYDGDYPYGSAPEGEYRGKTTDVGSFPPNGFGLYDMHGNVWEWCEDLYDNGSYRVIRGGSWYDYAEDCRSAIRSDYSPGSRCENLGFRLGLSPGQQ